MNAGSLFSGIGGLDLGLERAGMTVRWQSEIDPYCCRVLAKHWPHVPNLGDVTRVDWSEVEPVDLICGGYPCQPFSLAGVRRGESDPRHLWPWFAVALRHLRPRWALLENVPGHLSLGFGRVLGDLAELGYDTEWDCIPAAAVGAPHLRYRVFVVAHARSHGVRQQPVALAERGGSPVAEHDGETGAVANANRTPRRQAWDAERGAGASEVGQRATQPRGRRSGAGRGHWAAEPDVDRVADGVPSRVDRLRALGNSVVPQVSEWVGRRIMEAAA